MARNLKDEDERNARVIEVAEYVKATHASTRQTATYFTNNKYKISNATVNDYLRNRLKKVSPSLYREVAPIIEEHLPKSYQTALVRQRIYSAVNMLFSDYTVNEIANVLGTTFDVVYNDLTVRLPKIESDAVLLNEVQNVLSRHSKENLRNQYENPAPFPKEYFKSHVVKRNESGKFISFQNNETTKTK